MSKRGNSLLRYALVYTSYNVVKNNDVFRAYYESKRASGKSHYNALGHCAAKLVRCIYAMWSKNEAFNLQ